MDRAKFSTIDIEPYRIDGAFLADLHDGMIESIGSHAEVEQSEAKFTFVIEGEGEIVRKAARARDLLDGKFNAEQVSVELKVYASHNEDNSSVTLLSVTLNQKLGDHVYADGDAEIVIPAFNMIRAMLASKAIPQENRDNLPTVHKNVEDPKDIMVGSENPVGDFDGNVLRTIMLCCSAAMMIMSFLIPSTIGALLTGGASAVMLVITLLDTPFRAMHAKNNRRLLPTPKSPETEQELLEAPKSVILLS